MSGRIAASRSAAVKAAQAAKARRDAERLEHERRVEEALADFYEATARAGSIRLQAQARARKLLADAERAASEPETVAKQALLELSKLGEARDQIAELTGLTLAEVRATLNEAATGPASGETADPVQGPMTSDVGSTDPEQGEPAVLTTSE